MHTTRDSIVPFNLWANYYRQTQAYFYLRNKTDDDRPITIIEASGRLFS